MCEFRSLQAWFRELPQGVLDELTPEQVLECHTEEETVALVKLLPPTQAALLDWAVNLMADVVQEEVVNKMNARNIAMVFAPNMTQVGHAFDTYLDVGTCMILESKDYRINLCCTGIIFFDTRVVLV